MTTWAINALAGIEPYEVRQVSRPTGGGLAQRSTRPDYACSRIWSRTRAGRGSIVAVYHSSGHTWKIIGAREMTTEELAEFAKWEERDE